MKSKAVILTSLLAVSAITCSGALIFGQRTIRMESAKAVEKSFNFSSASWIPGITGQSLKLRNTMSQNITFTDFESYTTGNAIQAILQSNGTSSDYYMICDSTNNYFMRSNFNGDWSYSDGYAPQFGLTISINNLTSLSWNTKKAADVTGTLNCIVSLYSGSTEVIDREFFAAGEQGIASISDFLTSKGKEVVKIDKAVLRVIVSDNTEVITAGHMYGFEYISGTWSC